MKKLEKIVSALIGVAIFFNGCVRPVRYFTDSEKESATTSSDIRIRIAEVAQVDTDKLNVENLINLSQNYIDFLSFKKKYSKYSALIMDNLGKSNFSVADSLVRELGKKLEEDTDPYAKLYLASVQNFSYIRRKEQTIRRQYDDIPIVNAILSLTQGHNYHTEEFVTVERYLVYPYQGKTIRLKE